MMQTTFERGMAEGKREGKIEGQRELIQFMLEERFGPLPQSAVESLKDLSDEELLEVAIALLRAGSLKELGLGD